jgi:phosphohistidine phosphatase
MGTVFLVMAISSFVELLVYTVYPDSRTVIFGAEEIMQLILWRHAEAVEGVPDMARALTKKGQKQAEDMAAFLHSHLPPNTSILVSPARRTQQTAQALNRPFITEPDIAPGCSPQAILQAANWPNEDHCVLIVGHQPALGAAAGLLMTGQRQYWSVKKGAVWWFDRRERDGDPQTILQLAISPDFL